MIQDSVLETFATAGYSWHHLCDLVIDLGICLNLTCKLQFVFLVALLVIVLSAITVREFLASRKCQKMQSKPALRARVLHHRGDERKGESQSRFVMTMPSAELRLLLDYPIVVSSGRERTDRSQTSRQDVWCCQ